MVTRSVFRPVTRSVTRPVFGGAGVDPNLATLQGIFGAGDNGGIWSPWVSSTMFQDDGGTTAYTGAGDSIGLVRDQSGNGSDISQATPSERPVGDASAGFTAIKEDGADDSLSGDLGFDLGPATYVASILFRDDPEATVFPLRVQGTGAFDYLRIVGLSSSRVRVDVRSSSLGFANISTSTVTGYGTSPVIIEAVLRDSSGNHEVCINGGTPGTVSSTWTGGTAGPSTLIFPGGISADPTYFGGGLIIDREPSSGERASIREALAAVSGITLP